MVAPINVRDTSNDHQVDMNEIEKAYKDRFTDAKLNATDDTAVTFDINGKTYSWAELKELYQKLVDSGAASGDNLSPDAVAKEALLEGKEGLEKEYKKLQQAKSLVEQAKSELATTPDSTQFKDALSSAESTYDMQKKKLEEIVQEAREAGVKNLGKYQRALGDVSGKASTTGDGDSTSDSGSSNNAGQSNGAKASTGGANSTGNNTPPFGNGNGAAQGYPSFSTDDFMRASIMDGNRLDTLGDISKSQADGNKIMMLFMYFARMAASGDLGAMYQFIKFINFIVAKDKAKQNIDMSTKLIQLQDASRKATEVLLAADSPDGTDAAKSNDFMKLMEKTKAEEGTISTSQKLIADMMQDFGNVVESGFSLEKAIQQAYFNAMQTVTRAR